MKRIFLFLSAAALVAMAGCTKNEFASSAEQEISYQTVIGSINTKADNNSFVTTAGFHSYVYKHSDAFATAKTNAANFQKYIDTDISYVINYPDAGKNVWKAGETYYWPKSDYLTFYAVSDGVSKPFSIAGGSVSLSCDPVAGIQLSGYNITSNPNQDLLVAERKEDMKSTATMTSTSADPKWLDGVPTIFKHKLSSFVFKAKTDKVYAKTTFYVRAVNFYNVNSVGNYVQDPEAWNSATPVAFNMFTAESSNGGVVIPTSGDKYGAKVVADGTSVAELTASTVAGDYTILMPQTLNAADDVKIEVIYDIITTYTGSEVRETAVSNAQLKTVYPSNWEIGKKYTLTITFTMDEILWDPAVEDWTSGTVLEPFKI